MEDGIPRNPTAYTKDDNKSKKRPTATQDDGRQGALNPNRASFKPFHLLQDTDLA